VHSAFNNTVRYHIAVLEMGDKRKLSR